MPDLRFTTDRAQLRGLVGYIAVVALVGSVLTGAWWLGGPQSAGLLGPWAVGADLGAVLGLYAWVWYARAFSECTQAGIRTRGLAGSRAVRWVSVRDIEVHPSGQTSSVMVTCVDGTSSGWGPRSTGSHV